MDRSTLMEAVHAVTLTIELLGIAVIILGALYSGYRFVRDAGASGGQDAFAGLRSNLGRSILLGLELLVAADIINTVAIEPTLDSVLVLGAIVLIRTFLSFSLEVEIEGRWPWQRGAREA
jgi:uncharacterized membrane protein